MTEALASGAATPAAWLLTYLVHSTVLMGGVWAVARLGFVSRPGTLDVLWKTALVGGLVTASASVMRPDQGAVWVEARAVAFADAEMETLHLEGVSPGAAQGCRDAMGALERTTLYPGRGLAPRLEAVRAACGRARGTGPGGLTGLWLLGAVAGLFGMAVRGRRTRDVLGPLSLASPRSRRILRALVERAGVRSRPRVWVSHLVASPCVVGRTIVLSARSDEDLTDGQLEATLTHEVAHVARHDGAWMLLAEALVVVFWMQPLHRVARSALRDTAELVCDDWAVSRLRHPVDLARSITRVAEWSVPGRLTPGVAMARRGEGSPAERVRRIVQGRSGPPGRGRVRAAAAGALLLGVGFVLPAVPAEKQIHAVAIRKVVVHRVVASEWTGDGSVTGASSALRALPPSGETGPRGRP